jgi:hypothetical protein
MKRFMILHSRRAWGAKAELYFDNVEVVSNRTDRIVVDAIFSMDEGVYFNHMDFKSLQEGMMKNKYFMELEKLDKLEPTDMIKVRVESVKFVESRRKITRIGRKGNNYIEIKMQISFLYE